MLSMFLMHSNCAHQTKGTSAACWPPMAGVVSQDVSYHGIYRTGLGRTVKSDGPTIVLKEIFDGDLWIKGCSFISPESLNDINIIDKYTLVTNIVKGNCLPGYEYEVNENNRVLCYLLVDGIYPHWAIFCEQDY